MKKLFPDKDIHPISLPIKIKPSDKLFPLTKGRELFNIDAFTAQTPPPMSFDFGIVLNEPNIIVGTPIIEALQTMVSAVKDLEPIFSSELQ